MSLNALYKMTHWEVWDWRLKYIPLIPTWLWYCFRSGSIWFFTPSNPSLAFGGFDGLSKKEMYDQLPPGSYPKSIFISNTFSFVEVQRLFTLNNFEFPMAVKPEVGRMGFMFRKIESFEELKLYHEKMRFNYILQHYIDYPLEVSVFYYRYPNDLKGIITGFIKKEYLQVTGDGKSSLYKLILNYPRVRFRLEEMKLKHREKLDTIIIRDEVFCLSHALNLSRGGRLVNIEHEKDEDLLKVFDDLSHYTKHFCYGRYDIKCASIEDLKKGRNFCILEYNGSGAEPHHVYGNGNSLWKACKILAHHWGILYKISKYNRTLGINYWNLTRGWKFMLGANKHVRALKQLDSEFPAFN